MAERDGAEHRRYYDRGGITCELTGRAAMAHELHIRAATMGDGGRGMREG